MRTLVLLRGAPGCGKSTFVKNLGLENYTISSDMLRLLYASPVMKVNGEFDIPQNVNSSVWQQIEVLLNFRMQNGEFTIIDACHASAKDFKIYKDLLNRYKYRAFIVDFTDVPIDVCKKQNASREPLKRVPEYVIDRMYESFSSGVPSGFTIIKPENFLEEISQKPVDLSKYDKIVHIGDIHGCYDTLMKYFEKNPMDDKTCYIFLGDYCDRGDQNVEVIKFIMSIKDLENVCLLEGNHERHLRDYSRGVVSKSSEFEKVTKQQLLLAGFTESDARQLYRKCRQCSYYTYRGKEVFASHGGISAPVFDKLTFLSTRSITDGVGDYGDYDDVARLWMSKSTENQYLVNGHRNIADLPIDVFGDETRVFNLEGGVEMGGQLRILELTDAGWNSIYIDSVQKTFDPARMKVDSVDALITSLRASRYVKEKNLGNNISSFNFTKQAFYGKNWNAQTTKARGLFIDTELKEIVARSYEKFFNVDEVAETRMNALASNLKFPVKAYLKENGFLGILSYNQATGNLFIASKSTNSGDYANYFKNILYKYDVSKIQNWLKKNNYSLVFEVIDVENDPHIIEYKESKLVLLDAIENGISFSKLPYEELQKLAGELDLPCKELSKTLNNWFEFEEFYKELGKYNPNSEIEGYVVEDNDGFMFKIKGAFYLYWKAMRAEIERYHRLGDLYDPEFRDIRSRYIWNQFKANSNEIKNVIDLRNIIKTKKS